MKDPFRFPGFVAAETSGHNKVTFKIEDISVLSPAQNGTDVVLKNGTALTIKVSYKEVRDKWTGIEGDNH